MNRKILIALALFASTAYVACGGEEGKGAADPTSAASVSAAPSPAPSPVETAAPAPSPSPSVTVSAEPPKPKSLFERLGGKDAIVKVVDGAVKNIADDKRINKYFAKTVKDPKKLDAFKGHIVDQICAATGGPCEYKGKDMKAAHKGMKIKDADFDAFVEDFTKSLDANGVGKQEKDELLGALAPMKADMVEGKPAAAPAKSAAPAAPAKSAAPAKK